MTAPEGESREPDSVTFTAFQAGRLRAASYDLSEIASAKRIPVDAEYADLVIRMKDGRTDRLRVANRTAVNVCERVARRQG